MGMPVVTVAAGGMPVVEAVNGMGAAITEVAAGRGMAVTKVAKYGMPVVYVTVGGVVVPPGSWVTAWQTPAAFDLDSPGWTTTPNMRQHWAENLLTQNGSKVRLTLQGPTTEGSSFAAMRMGHAVSIDDFDGTQVPVTVGGAAAFVVPANTTIVTDEIPYPFDHSKGFITSVFFNNAAFDITRGRNSVAGCSNHFKSGASEVNTSVVSGYTLSGSALRVVSKIEVFQSA